MTDEVSDVLKPLFGNKCCRIRVGDFKSLSIGFGEKIYHNKPKLIDKFRGEWEIGTYYCAWRIMTGNSILCASSDSVETITELHNRAIEIKIGSILSIVQTSDIDVRVKTDSGIDIDFLATISGNDQYFHIFGPNYLYVELATGGQWTIGKSNVPFVRG